VKEFLTGLPGGFWTQFIVVMAVIFILGFFLDFIEIAVVVVPIVAPILLADPSANITAVWLGVMIGLNIQTSFLTPPFGFALFYLRGVAPPSVKTTQIYKGAFAFILLQLLGLGIAGYFPALVNYMPNRTYLTSETAPPPVNPRLQYCMERRVFAEYRDNRQAIVDGIARAQALDLSALPVERGAALADGFVTAAGTFDMVARIDAAEDELDAYLDDYAPRQRTVRRTQIEIRGVERKLDAAQIRLGRLQRNPGAAAGQLRSAQAEVAELQRAKAGLEAQIPADWDAAKATYNRLAGAEMQARRAYRRHVDDAYQIVADTRAAIAAAGELAALESALAQLQNTITGDPPAAAMAQIAEVEAEFANIAGASPIRSGLAKTRRALKVAAGDGGGAGAGGGDGGDGDGAGGGDGDVADAARAEATRLLVEARALFAAELTWRAAAADALLPELNRYNDTVKTTIGLRLQPRLTTDQAKAIAACQSAHRDISLSF